MKGEMVVDAGELMAASVRKLAEGHQWLRGFPGLAFWPVPALFPLILSRCIDLVQSAVAKAYVEGASELGDILAEVRCKLLTLVYEGDLGENHTRLFLRDHPKVVEFLKQKDGILPFHYFCRRILEVADPLILLGAVLRNEEGSENEIRALVEEGLISEGPYSATHLVVEERHALIAAEIRQIVVGSLEGRQLFCDGERLHDDLYQSVLAWSPSSASMLEDCCLRRASAGC